MTVRFSNQLVAELIQPFWAAWQAREFMTDVSAIAGTFSSVSDNLIVTNLGPTG